MSVNKSFCQNPVLRRLAPPLAFIFAICLLVVCCYDSGHTSLPPTEKRYVAAKAGIASLRQDAKKNMQRESWEKLATEFRSIYDADPAWPNRPAALFRAAESLEELARRSCSRQDARKAIACYESVALRHAESRLADDALFHAAQMRAAWLKDDKGALALLARIRKQYPKGDMLAEAAALEKAIRASANGKTAPDAVKAAAAATSDAREEPTARTGKKNGFAGELPLRLRAAKSRMAALAADPMRSCWRQPWEDVRDEFLRIHQAGKNAVAPDALYHAAEAQKALAVCSRVSGENKKARDLYLKVATDYPGHNLADDSLLNAARIQYALPGGQADAGATLSRLIKTCPKGDKVPEARKLLSIWQQSGPSKTAQPAARPVAKKQEQPELQVLSWDSINKNNVEIVLEMSRPTAYAARLEKTPKGSPARLVVELENAQVVNDVRKGVNINGSLLKAVRVRDTGKGAALQFDFREVRRFDARSEKNPCRIILNVAAGKAAPAQQKKAASTLQAGSGKQAKVRAMQVSNMASQLGLTVQRVFIDPGHGGKDPGTSHNKVIERVITLDIATTLGQLLKANGLEVIYSRTSDRSLLLSERTARANAAHADLFVSIHVNANDNPSANGLETYYLDLASNQQAARVAMLENAASDKRLGDMQAMLAEVMLHARAHESRNLAADIQRLAISRLKKRNYATRSNGVKSAPFHVLLGARMPAVLVEVGYCSNPAEAANLASPKYRHALAEGLAEGIMAYRDRLARNHTAQK